MAKVIIVNDVLLAGAVIPVCIICVVVFDDSVVVDIVDDFIRYCGP